METNWLDEFRGQHITVVTQAGSDEKSDAGTLLRVADGWMQLVKDNGEMVLFPSTAIRMVKLLDMAHRTVAVERVPALDYAAPAYPPSDTGIRSHAPDDKTVL